MLVFYFINKLFICVVVMFSLIYPFPHVNFHQTLGFTVVFLIYKLLKKYCIQVHVLTNTLKALKQKKHAYFMASPNTWLNCTSVF